MQHADKLMNRQSQRSGDNSTQLSASGNINIGITEARAREISTIVAKQVVEQYASEGLMVIQDRITKLDDRVLAELIRQGRLEVFTDPGFQRAYRTAQESAAVSDKETDYDLLAGLIIKRTETNNDRSQNTTIEQCISLIDKIDIRALQALTVLYFSSHVFPIAASLKVGLDAYEASLNKLIDFELPRSQTWIEHLDSLNVIRINHFAMPNSFEKELTRGLSGYVSRGAPQFGPTAPFSHTHIPQQSLPLIVPHELRPGFDRFAAASPSGWLSLKELPGLPDISDEQHQAIQREAEEKYDFGRVDESLIPAFMEEVRSRPTLSKVEAWRSELPIDILFTMTSRTLAAVNAHRLDPNFILPQTPEW